RLRSSQCFHYVTELLRLQAHRPKNGLARYIFLAPFVNTFLCIFFLFLTGLNKDFNRPLLHLNWLFPFS
ncbi:MAG TPA: hypothetical protein VE868_02030, partial [Balneolaceae bacterium]|nr:hypothetical protein [Balneolaceae bacterium]